MAIFSVWQPQPYPSWYKCHESGDYDVYTPDNKSCIVAKGPLGTRAIKPNGRFTAKMYPRLGIRECMGGPDTSAADLCFRLWDRDQDGDVDLWDVADWSNSLASE